ncbi:MAG: hypothetical protein ACP5GX_01785 [Anaerolineae bacterium]
MMGLLALAALFVITFAVIGRPMKSGTWEGFIYYIADTSTFRCCSPRETWWLKGKRYTDLAEQVKKRHAEIAEGPYEQVYARLKGKINKTKGQYGPLGTYHRVLYVSEIVEMRERRPEDCR